ncbi:hypothetical protein GCM10027592_29580 [Spirosoma flavus]
MTTLKTTYRRDFEKRKLAVITYYNKLASTPGAMKMACTEKTMKKFGIKSRVTVWRMVANKGGFNIS